MLRQLIILSLLVIAVFTTGLNAQSNWEIVYHNNPEGDTVAGSIEDLKTAIRNGEEIRIAWGSSRVEHLANAKFITIMTDSTVHAQIDPILGQVPDFENQTIVLKENLEWTLLVSSSGLSDAITRHIITGEILGHNQRPRAIKWYVRK